MMGRVADVYIERITGMIDVVYFPALMGR